MTQAPRYAAAARTVLALTIAAGASLLAACERRPADPTAPSSTTTPSTTTPSTTSPMPPASAASQ